MLALLNPPSFAVILMVYFDLCSNLQPLGHSGFASPSPLPSIQNDDTRSAHRRRSTTSHHLSPHRTLDCIFTRLV